MEGFVQMSLKTYDSLKSNVEYLKGALKKEQESHSEDVTQAKKEINDLAEKIDQYKQHILESNCKSLNIEVYSLEQYLSIDSWTYGMNYKDELLNLGFTKQEMDGFICDKYDELVKQKEEEDEYKPTMEEISNSMDLLKYLANKADSKHEEMTASEMFDKLGYKRNVRNKRIIYYLETKGAFYYKEITFDLLQKEIVIDGNFIRTEIENDLLRAIDKQAEELGWLYEKTCINESEFDSIDEFECSNCGIVLSEYQQIEIDEDDGERYFYDYRPKYCPNCGRKIVDLGGNINEH